MCNFETVLQHIGPSASPLMSFLYNDDAKSLVVINKYISGFVLRHKARWGFAIATFSSDTDGNFSIGTSKNIRHHGPLTSSQRLVFTNNFPFGPKTSPTHAVYISNNNISRKRLIECTKDEFLIIKKAALPFIEAHKFKTVIH